MGYDMEGHYICCRGAVTMNDNKWYCDQSAARSEESSGLSSAFLQLIIVIVVLCAVGLVCLCIGCVIYKRKYTAKNDSLEAPLMDDNYRDYDRL